MTIQPCRPQPLCGNSSHNLAWGRQSIPRGQDLLGRFVFDIMDLWLFGLKWTWGPSTVMPWIMSRSKSSQASPLLIPRFPNSQPIAPMSCPVLHVMLSPSLPRGKVSLFRGRGMMGRIIDIGGGHRSHGLGLSPQFAPPLRDRDSWSHTWA